MSERITSPLRSVLFGMAYGEALSWTSMYERSQNLPLWLSRIRRNIETESRDEHITSHPKPFSLNQTPEPLKPAPGDITEWAAWTASLLAENSGELSHGVLDAAWQKLAASRKDIRGRISIQATLRNIETGMTAPQTGRFNPHYFDDAALGRAAIIGTVHSSNMELAQNQTKLDAAFTHFEDGIWSALSVATLFSLASNGDQVDTMIQEAIQCLPQDSMAKTCVSSALIGCEQHNGNVLELARFLNADVCNQIYSYGNIAHEILACLLAILKTCKGDFDKMLACAALVPSAGAGLLALSAALAAILSPQPILMADKTMTSLAGHSLPDLKILDLAELALRLENLNPSINKDQE